MLAIKLRSRLVLHFTQSNNMQHTLEEDECVHELYMSQCNVIP